MIKLKRYKPLLKEMAHIGNIKDISIDVYSDHKPPHFHVTKKDCFEVRLAIKTLEIINYKWQKNGKEISTKELNSIKDWLEKGWKKDKDISNYRMIKNTWEVLNG